MACRAKPWSAAIASTVLESKPPDSSTTADWSVIVRLLSWSLAPLRDESAEFLRFDPSAIADLHREELAATDQPIQTAWRYGEHPGRFFDRQEGLERLS